MFQEIPAHDGIFYLQEWMGNAAFFAFLSALLDVVLSFLFVFSARAALLSFFLSRPPAFLSLFPDVLSCHASDSSCPSLVGLTEHSSGFFLQYHVQFLSSHYFVLWFVVFGIGIGYRVLTAEGRERIDQDGLRGGLF